MSRHLQSASLLILGLAFAIAPALGDEKKDAPKPKVDTNAAEKPATPPPTQPPATIAPTPATPPAPPAPPVPPHHVVKKEPFKIDLTLTGVFEAKNAHEVQLKPEAWQAWMVTKVAEHGTRVKKGDVIIQFDTKALDEVIKDVEAGRAISDLEYQAAQEQLSMMEETVPLDLAAAERTKQYFDEDVKRYFEIEAPIAKRMAEESLKSVENMLAYEMEELRQLEKMYKADDLTEETEEIVLKRQRDTIARLQFSLERAKLNRDEALKVSIPREELQVKNGEKISEIRLRNARSNFPRLLAQQRLAVQKMTRDREKSVEQLKKLKKDRAAMTVKSPIDGILYYGQAQRGSFTGVGPIGQMLGDGTPLKPGMILLTVVAPRPLVVRSTVAEASLALAKPDITGKLTSVGFGDLAVPAKLDSVGLVPLAPGTFDAVVSAPLDSAPGAESIVPGMSCSVKLVAYEKKDALTVPSGAVQTDESDEAKKFVYVLEADNKNRKQDVKPGKSAGGKTEILSGLKEGDKVLLNKP